MKGRWGPNTQDQAFYNCLKDKWGSPIYLKAVIKVDPNSKSSIFPTEDQYFRVKPVDYTIQYYHNPENWGGLSTGGGVSEAVQRTYMDKTEWDSKFLQQREQWAKSFTAIQNSPDCPDKTTVDKYVAELLGKPPQPEPDRSQYAFADRRLACETSPFVDFLSVLALLLPLLFLLYWMFLRRIYYPKRNTPAIQKTVKARFRAAL